MIFGPELNDGTHYFVFGSNRAGRHGKGAALQAKTFWGAINGQGQGPQGCSYAIPTKDENLNPLSLREIGIEVGKFLDFAYDYPDITFLVTKIGCGLAGNDEADIRPMFTGAPPNCLFAWDEGNYESVRFG